jgi:hypothetical protein
MVVMSLIVGAFFVALLAIAYFAVQQTEADRGAPLDALAPPPRVGAPDAACAGCRDVPSAAPASTSDQVVFEVEHRIDAERRDIAHALHAHPRSLARLFHG